MHYFVLKLISPRPTFPADMTPTEKDLMGQHVRYWSKLMRAKKTVIFGPVADPAGAYGLAIASVEDPADIPGLTAHDPIVQANLGFRYEVAPMSAAILPHLLPPGA